MPANIEAFKAQYGSAAIKAGDSLGVSPDILLGQWGLETGWGKSVIPGTNNLGNIKDFSGTGVSAKDNANGSVDKYRKYDTPEAFADDFTSLIKRKYPGAVNAGGDANKFATALKSGGYAEDPLYVNKVTTAAGMAGHTADGAVPTPVSFTAPAPRVAGTAAGQVKAGGDNTAMQDLFTEINRNTALADTVDSSRAASKVSQAADVATEAQKQGKGISSAFNTAIQDPTVMPTWAILDAVNKDPEVTTPGWYMANKDRIEAGRDDEERAYMRENVKGEQSLLTADAQLMMRRDNAKEYGLAGGMSSFVGQMGAGVMDPASLLLGAGVSKAFGVLKIGHAALAASGRGVAASGALLAENALANVAIEGVADAMGEVKTTSDYVLAGASGAALAAPFSRGVFKSAANAAVEDASRGLREAAVRDQHGKVEDILKKDPTLTPMQAARRMEDSEAQSIREAVDHATQVTPIREHVIPDEVNAQLRKEYEGEPLPRAEEPVAGPFDATGEATPFPKLEAIDAKADIDAASRQVPFVRDPIQVGAEVRKAVEGRGEVLRSIPAKDGGSIELGWSLHENTLKSQFSVRDTLAALGDRPGTSPQVKRTAKYLSDILSDSVGDVNMRFSKGAKNGYFDPKTQAISLPSVVSADMPLKAHLEMMSDWHLETVLHEVTHAAMHSKLTAFELAPHKLAPELRASVEQLHDLFGRYKEQVGSTPMSGDKNVQHQINYATKDIHEFASQLMASRNVREFMNAMPGKSVAGRASNAWREFISIIKKMLGGDKHTAFDEGSRLLDTIIQADGSNIKYDNGIPALFGPEQQGASARSHAEAIYAHAEAYVAKNPIDIARTKVITNKIGGTSDGLVLAMSKNPVLQMVAGLVTETTTGAAGRKATVAIRQKMMHAKLLGDSVIDFDNSYHLWRGQNGGSAVEDIWRGAKKREFSKMVYEETLNRRQGSYTPHASPEVVEAADGLEALFTRAAKAQKEAGTLGSANLPSSSRGYMPQALDGSKLQALNVADTKLLHDELSLQFQQNLGWDAAFSDLFAPYYTDRVRRRAQGDKGIDGLAAGGDAAQVVRDTLDEMAYDPNLRDRAAAANQAKAGMSQTKKRLDIDLTKELRPGLKIMDVYNTDPLLLARTYAKRTAGTVALTESGIHGIRGIRELRAAAANPVADGSKVTLAELGAFDRVMAETLGTPTAGDVVSAGASNMQLLVTLQRLGSLPFTQTAELFNMINHLGLRSLLSGVSELPKMFGEVGRLKRGQASGNHILTSIEQYGGEIGTNEYKMVAHLDAPDERLGEYMDQPGVMSRLLRAGGHAQSKISGFRGLLAAQHRMVAEQITMRAARFIRDGKDDVALRGMGFTKDVADSLKADLANVAEWDSHGNLRAFDLTKVSDPRTAEAFVQAVHRGTSQIIQGTFIGEKNKWFHNDYLKLLLQLRSFGITSAEKQWGRTRMDHNYAYAGAMMIGQMALALPIHLARIQLASAGRDDRDKFIKDNMNPASIVKAVMNYSSLTGFTGDVLEITSGIAGGWGGKNIQQAIGAKPQAMGVGKMVPVAGTIDSAMRVASGKADLHTGLKQLPFSNLWYLIPAINLAKHN